MSRSCRIPILYAALSLLLAALLPLALCVGSVDIGAAEVWHALTGADVPDTTRFIVVESRLPAAVTALFAGAALAVAGLLMQTCFDNPLAGPSIMGISSGSSLGVALVVLGGIPLSGVWSQGAIVLGALLGALAVLGVILLFSAIVRSAEVLLIIGILVGYLATSAISFLNYFAPERAVHGYVMWGMGNFNGVDISALPYFVVLCSVLCLMSAIYVKCLNIILFGGEYAHSVGVPVWRLRIMLLIISGALTAVVTAWCGPIGFIGLAVPHMARMLSATSNHRIVLPVTVLTGALTGILCQVLSALPSQYYAGQLPVNAITPLIGVPVITYVLLKRRRLLYFN